MRNWMRIQSQIQSQTAVLSECYQSAAVKVHLDWSYRHVTTIKIRPDNKNIAQWSNAKYIYSLEPSSSVTTRFQHEIHNRISEFWRLHHFFVTQQPNSTKSLMLKWFRTTVTWWINEGKNPCCCCIRQRTWEGEEERNHEAMIHFLHHIQRRSSTQKMPAVFPTCDWVRSLQPASQVPSVKTNKPPSCSQQELPPESREITDM